MTSVRTRLVVSLFLVISLAFLVTANWTVGVVSDSLFTETATRHLTDVTKLSATLGERITSVSVDIFYRELAEAARQMGGRLLAVNMDNKVVFDTFDQRCGSLLPLGEVIAVLENGADTDYGFHLHDSDEDDQTPGLTSSHGGPQWEGCFTAALLDDSVRLQGALALIVSLQDTVDKLNQLRERMLTVFGTALIGVLLLAGLLSRMLTRPIRELSAGIERMGRGDYGQPVHVRGRGEMAELAAAFNEMSEKVHSLDESRNQFVSNASHELKTPLATMKILVESMLYQDDMEPEVFKEFLGDINREIDRLSAVVGDLLTLVRIDSHKLALKREAVCFADIVRESAGRLQPLAEKHGLEMTVETEDPCRMEADAGKLTQVCYNIISNAIKYTPEGGKIRVHLKRSNRDAVLEVSDTGVGIAAKDLPHIFDRFYRADKSRSRDGESGGTGLGLSIVRQIVRLHAGTVTVRSEPGAGSVFTVLLPVTEAERK